MKLGHRRRRSPPRRAVAELGQARQQAGVDTRHVQLHQLDTAPGQVTAQRTAGLGPGHGLLITHIRTRSRHSLGQYDQGKGTLQSG